MNRARHWMWAGVLAALAGGEAAAGQAVPGTHLPPAIVAELKSVENQFDLALAQDCAPERCFSKGCSYIEHSVVDQPRSGSLPGLGQTEGPGSVPAQEYLTRARCEFAIERSVDPKDAQALIKRLSTKLSKGWLVVTVERQVLEPVPAGLREAPSPAPPEASAKPAIETPEQPPWELATAMRELWLALLPHFSWMIAVFLATVAAMTIIWSLRRLGKETLEEKALAARLSEPPALPAGEPAVDGATPQLATETEQEKLPAGASDEEKGFVEGQRALWHERIAGAQLAKGESVVLDLLREWLRIGEFALLAKAVFVFSDQLSLSFPTEGDLAQRKLEFAEYLRKVDESRLPSDADFFRKLNQYALSSAVLVQPDADVYRSLREEFGASGIARLMDVLPPRPGALLFAVAPIDYQDDVARALSAEHRKDLAEQLLLSNRIAKDEIAHLIDVVRAARSGLAVPESRLASGLVDRGREFDAAEAVSTLMGYLDPKVRSNLFAAALERGNGSFPRWYEEILFADMLMRLPDDQGGELALEVDVRELAGWLSVQPLSWQPEFVKRLPPSLRSALSAAMAFGSREDQLILARRGRRALASALQRLAARGRVSFTDLFV